MRLFEYNRFSNEDISEIDDAGTIRESKKERPNGMHSRNVQKVTRCACPSYSELYPEMDGHLKNERAASMASSRTRNTDNDFRNSHHLSNIVTSYENDDQDDCQLVTLDTAPRKSKVYNCMREFLRKKFLQLTSSVDCEGSDMSEVVYESMLNSYQIQNAYDDDSEDGDDDECLLVLTPSHQNKPESKWLQLQESDEDATDSDTGIRDCCQLLTSSSSPRHEKTPRKSPEFPMELRNASWFQPHISSKLAVTTLTPQAPGSFIIRKTTDQRHENYILHLRLESKVKKYVIVGSPRRYKIKGAQKEFSSLKALVTHHSLMAEQLPTTLTLPRDPNKLQSHRHLDDYDTYESLQLLGVLQLLQAKNFEFS